ncbi:MAG: HAD family hydrolase [Nitrospirae bacterium]|nr:HAD family hydrolase [Nitrospirota bacterium]MBI5695268.1 HAD family hydrolase [Nitrospirota bacterium]
MTIKAILFDLYGTLVNIRTDEGDPEVYRQLSRFLSYNHVFVEPEPLRRFYSEKIKAHIVKSREQYPDVDVLKVFSEIVHEYGTGKMEPRLPLYTARLYRSLTRRTFEPFPGVYGMLERLRDRYPLALVSDAQRCYTDPEIESLKLGWFFDHIFLSSDHGFRKPDPKYFNIALKALGVKPSEAVYVGDNAYRDLLGARKTGMRMVLVRSSEREYEGETPDAYIEEIASLEGVLEELDSPA